MHSRFEQQSFTVVKDVEECVLSGKVSEVVKSHPELDTTRLAVQLPMFRGSFQYSCAGASAESDGCERNVDACNTIPGSNGITVKQPQGAAVILRSGEDASTTAGAASVFMRS